MTIHTRFKVLPTPTSSQVNVTKLDFFSLRVPDIERVLNIAAGFLYITATFDKCGKLRVRLTVYPDVQISPMIK